jgi:hypothetical protein
MKRHSTIFLLCVAAVLAGCSKQPAPVAATPSPETAMTSMPALEPNSADVVHAKLNASGVAAEYSARFDGQTLVRIDERRQPQSGGPLEGEYSFQGARLLRYRGAALAHPEGAQPAMLDLQFDMQGVLQSARTAELTDENIDAIRGRAQLLRSHALAQRAARQHSNY